MVPLTIFPDACENARDIEFRVIGVYGSIPPTSAGAEVVTMTAALPRASMIPPDLYPVRVAPNRSAAAVAASLHAGPLAQKFGIATITPRTSAVSRLSTWPG